MNDGGNLSQHESQELNGDNFQQHGSASESAREEFEYCLDDILASGNFEPDPSDAARHDAAPSARSSSLQEGADAPRNEPRADRRRRRRTLISVPVRVRGINVTDAVVDETSTTIDVSRAGILFLSSSPNYARGMEVAVIFPYCTAPVALHAEQPGRVVRAFETPEGRYAVAVALGEGIGEDLVDACGRKLVDASPVPRTPLAPPSARIAANTYAASTSLPGANPAGLNAVTGAGFFSREPNSKRPLVLIVDADEMVRLALKGYLTGEGYDVMSVSNSPDAREVLNLFTPALVIAEVEGEGLPGYDLCAHVKQNPRLKHVPVVLTTSSGYPSDYSNAHSLGAIVCMTKPYKQERLGHVVRLLVPPPAEFCSQKTGAAPPPPADPSRRCRYGVLTAGLNRAAANAGNGTAGSGAKIVANAPKRFKFPSFRSQAVLKHS